MVKTTPRTADLQLVLKFRLRWLRYVVIALTLYGMIGLGFIAAEQGLTRGEYARPVLTDPCPPDSVANHNPLESGVECSRGVSQRPLPTTTYYTYTQWEWADIFEITLPIHYIPADLAVAGLGALTIVGVLIRFRKRKDV